MRLDQDRRALLAVFAAAVVAYATALGGTFVYDDVHTVRDNEALRSLANLPRLLFDPGTFSSLDVRMYRPAVTASLAVDHALGGGATWAFKATNVLCHAMCAVLVLALSRALGVARAPACVAALLFAVHPLASEAVNIVSARSDLLLALGLLLGLRCYVAAQDGSRRALLGVAAGAAIACGGKETGALLPFLCLVLEVVRRAPGHGRLAPWQERALRLAPAFAVAGMYLVARRLLLGMATASVPKLTGGHDVLNGAGRDLLTQACIMAHVLPRFLVQSLVPVQLTLDPWIPLHADWLSAPVLCGWAAIALLTLLGLRAPRRRPVVFAGTVLAWACALPWVVLPLNLPACEHRFYPSLAGLSLVLAAVLPATLRLRSRAVAAVLVVAGVTLAGARSLDYRDPAVLWRGVLQSHPDSVRGLCGLALQEREAGLRARAAGDAAEFVRHLRAGCDLLARAIEVYPQHWAARRNLAEFELELGPEHGSAPRAVDLAESLIAADPTNPFDRLLLSRALLATAVASGEEARFDAAVAAALSCLEVAAPKGLVYRTAASVRAAQGDRARAIELLDRSVAHGLDHESVLLQRAEYLIAERRTAAAERDLRKVLGRDPFNRTALQLLERARGATPLR